MIKIDLDKAKVIAHDLRRANRAEAFKPLDIQATVPHLAEEAESKRSVVRKNDDALQEDIAACDDVTKLTSLTNAIVLEG